MIEHIHPGDLAQWISKVQAHGRPVVLDVREPHELQQASIRPGADYDLVTIPMGAIPPRLGELDPVRPVACLCHHGGRSMRVAEFLKHHGFREVANISGGINAWAIQVDPTVPRY
ncbi:MAG: rhodanese-like domain-containing protein [Curvibacter sp.]|jgi:rhodanese-related sulfurtransferase|nr:sulfurtransferase [Curvibacter sp.]